MNGNMDLSIGIGIFDRISDDIIQYLAEPNRIGTQGRQRWSDLDVHMEIFGLDLSLQHVNGITQNSFQLHKLTTGIHTRLNAAKVEQIIDQRCNMLNTILEAPQEVMLV